MADHPDQLALFALPEARQPTAAAAPPRAWSTGRRRPSDQLELRLNAAPVAIAGGGEGSGHRRAVLTALPGGKSTSERPLPSRDEITTALLGALADLVAGRISPTAAGAIRSAAEEALRRLEEAQRDPHRQPQFVRAVRALEELTGFGAR